MDLNIFEKIPAVVLKAFPEVFLVFLGLRKETFINDYELWLKMMSKSVNYTN